MLKLVTWNIQAARTPAGGADLDAVMNTLARFSSFDILCLQEVGAGFPARDGSPGGDQFAGLAARLPGYHAARSYALDLPGPDGARCRLGCMSFSRYPIHQVLRHSLPWPADAAVPSIPRIVLETQVETPAGLLRVLNTHLEYFSEAQRLGQVDALRALQREACDHARAPRPGLDPDGPFAPVPRAFDAVLAGDFNMLPGSASWQRLVAPFEDATPPWRDAWQLAHPGQPHAPTVRLHGSEAPFTFDFVFVGASLQARVRGMRVDDAVAGSDHQAVLLELA
jgi:endonuclease/exonuclease/phosphatase family metal-dependent hydrolase